MMVASTGFEWETRDVYTADGLGEVRWHKLLCGDVTNSETVTMGIAELAVGARLTRHRHALPETYYILEGTATVELAGELNEVGVGTAVFIPSNAIHTIMNTGTAVLRILYTFPTDKFGDVIYEYLE